MLLHTAVRDSSSSLCNMPNPVNIPVSQHYGKLKQAACLRRVSIAGRRVDSAVSGSGGISSNRLRSRRVSKIYATHIKHSQKASSLLTDERADWQHEQTTIDYWLNQSWHITGKLGCNFREMVPRTLSFSDFRFPGIHVRPRACSDT